VEHRHITFNGTMMSQIFVHICVLHKDKETHTLPTFNAARCNGKENVFAASDPYSELGDELRTLHLTINKYANTSY
jgi:hypothetical protein